MYVRTDIGLTVRDFGSMLMMIFAPKLCGVPKRSDACDYAFSNFGVHFPGTYCVCTHVPNACFEFGTLQVSCDESFAAAAVRTYLFSPMVVSIYFRNYNVTSSHSFFHLEDRKLKLNILCTFHDYLLFINVLCDFIIIYKEQTKDYDVREIEGTIKSSLNFLDKRKLYSCYYFY